MSSNNWVPNSLEKLASISYLWTLACLTKDEFNNPDETYRNYNMFPPERVVISSAGRFKDHRTPTAYGKQEYFIDNFEIDSAITGNADQVNGVGLTKITFSVLEPYSMGLFIQSCQVAALKANFTHYVQAPFVLKLDIVGFTDLGQANEVKISKYFAIHMTNMDLSVDHTGSKYTVNAVPASQLAYTDTNLTIRSNITLKTEPDEEYTVETVLKTGKYSLENELNKRAQHYVDIGHRAEPDEYLIEFPDTNIENVIKDATFSFDNTDGGIVWAMGESNERIREGIMILPEFGGKIRAFTYNRGLAITQIIQNVVLLSDYQATALEPDNYVENFAVLSFLVDIDVEILEYDKKINNFAKKFIYRVTPYLTPLTAHAPNNPSNDESLKASIAKGYNYWYTGQNTDVLKFEVQFNSLAKTFGNFNHTYNNPSNMAPDTMGAVESEVVEKTAPEQSDLTFPPTVPGSVSVANATSSNHAPGGAGLDKPELVVAKYFYEQVVTGAAEGDNISLTLEIKGDPYWLIDHGFNNYHPDGATVGSQINTEDSVNYPEIVPAIYITFKNPIDINEPGGMFYFPPEGDNAFFTGIYYIHRCKSFISGGVFKQELIGARVVQSFDLEYIGNSNTSEPKYINEDQEIVPVVVSIHDPLPKSS